MTSFCGLTGAQAIATSAATTSKCPHNHFWLRRFQQVSAHPLLSRVDAGSGAHGHTPAQRHSLAEACNSQWETNTRELSWDLDKEPEVSSNIRNAGESTATTSHASGLLPRLCQTPLWKQDIPPSAWNLPTLPGLHRHIPFLRGSLFLVSCTVKLSANQLARSV